MSAPQYYPGMDDLPRDSDYFKNKENEDSVLDLTEDQNVKYAKIDKLYNTFFVENSLSIAKESSKDERDQKSINDSSFVYGEVVNKINKIFLIDF
ncbi:MAG: hypothetical protein MJ252_13215 [archaeon]|nr:hypothetical protein [archaeon]